MINVMKAAVLLVGLVGPTCPALAEETTPPADAPASSSMSRGQQGMPDGRGSMSQGQGTMGQEMMGREMMGREMMGREMMGQEERDDMRQMMSRMEEMMERCEAMMAAMETNQMRGHRAPGSSSN